jgi:hypothetical protein
VREKAFGFGVINTVDLSTTPRGDHVREVGETSGNAGASIIIGGSRRSGGRSGRSGRSGRVARARAAEDGAPPLHDVLAAVGAAGHAVRPERHEGVAA